MQLTHVVSLLVTGLASMGVMAIPTSDSLSALSKRRVFDGVRRIAQVAIMTQILNLY